MKKIALLIFLSVIFSHAQKVDIEKERCSFKYIQLPKFPIKDAVTYSYAVEFKSGLKNIPANVSEFQIGGFQKVNQKGDIQILMRINDLVDKSENIEAKVEKKNLKGEVESERTIYNMLLSSKIVYDYIVIHGSTTIKEIQNEPLILKKNASESGFNSTKERSDWFLSNFGTFAKNQIQGGLNELIATLNADLNQKYGYQPKTENHFFNYLNPKKHPEGIAYFNNIKQLNGYINKVGYNEPIILDSIKTAHTYLDTLLVRYSTESKDDVKIRLSALNNLALINYFLDDFKHCEEYLEKMKLLEPKASFVVNLQRSIENTKELFNINKETIRKVNRSKLLENAILLNREVVRVEEQKDAILREESIKKFRRKQDDIIHQRATLFGEPTTKAEEIIWEYLVAIGGIDNLKKIQSLKIKTLETLNIVPIPLRKEEVIIDTNFYFLKKGKMFVFKKLMYDGIDKEEYVTEDKDRYAQWIEDALPKTSNDVDKIAEKMSVLDYIIPFDTRKSYNYVGKEVIENINYHVLELEDIFGIENPITISKNSSKLLLYKFYFDVNTGLYFGYKLDEKETGNPHSGCFYSEYHSFSEHLNILIPKKSRGYIGVPPNALGLNNFVINTKITDLELNPKVDKEEYRKILRKQEWHEKIPDSDRNKF